MAAVAVWFKKTSNIPGTGAMVSKLGFFFWHNLFAIYYTLSGGRLVEIHCWCKISVSSSLSTSTGATSWALKWPAKTIVGKATMKKPRSKMAAAAVRLRLQQSPNDAFGNRWTSWTSFPDCRNFLEGSFLLERSRQKEKINIQNPNMEVFLDFFNRQNWGNKEKQKSPDFQFSIFNVLAKNVEGWLIIVQVIAVP